jgi:hypothetical protein
MEMPVQRSVYLLRLGLGELCKLPFGGNAKMDVLEVDNNTVHAFISLGFGFMY